MSSEITKKKFEKFEWYSSIYTEAFNHYIHYVHHDADSGEEKRQHAHGFALKVMELNRLEGLIEDMTHELGRM